MRWRKAAFWIGGVGGTAVLANFFMELLSDRLPQGTSFQQFVSYIHRGGNNG